MWLQVGFQMDGMELTVLMRGYMGPHSLLNINTLRDGGASLGFLRHIRILTM